MGDDLDLGKRCELRSRQLGERRSWLEAEHAEATASKRECRLTRSSSDFENPIFHTDSGEREEIVEEGLRVARPHAVLEGCSLVEGEAPLPRYTRARRLHFQLALAFRCAWAPEAS